MYLAAQIWWCLLLAFLLGTLIGYVIWRWCGHRRLQESYERQKKDLDRRLAALEHERDRFSASAVEAERDNARLKEAIQAIRQAPSARPNEAHP